MSKTPKKSTPDISFVMTCYNEEEIIGFTIPKLVEAFEKSGYVLELIAVDNGSTDRTGDLIREMAERYPQVVPHRVEVNEGYGNGLLSGIPLCHAPWVGFIPADGQIDAEDVVSLYETATASNGRVLVKARRRFRMDGVLRKIVSATYNLFVRALYPRLESIDVNGTPKILPRQAVVAMRLTSRQWFFDPEVMIKAHYMGLRVLEFNVFARMRSGGMSHVRASTCWDFIRNMLRYRFTGALREWRRSIKDFELQPMSPRFRGQQRRQGG